MSIIDTYYEKIKLLINEYENILQLDKEYMTEYLKHCGKDLQMPNPQENEGITHTQLKEDDEILYTKSIADSISKMFYKQLARLLHPDKKKDSDDGDDFIKLNSAYESNDYLTLFLFYYESKLDINITEEIIKILDSEIQKKTLEIQKMKQTIYWQWNNSNDIQKHLIDEFVKNQL